jgi:hypothetical protein
MSVKRLVPLHAVALASDPSNSRIGDLYYNTSDNALKYYDGTAWNLIGGGAITGLLDHIHTYDGQVFSVSANEIASDGTIDGGIASSNSGDLPGNIDGGTP